MIESTEIARRIYRISIWDVASIHRSILTPGWLVAGLAALFLCTACRHANGVSGGVARGRYLVERVMMCGERHTPIVDGTRDRKRWLEGGPLPFPVGPRFASVAPPIAGFPPNWTRQQFVRFMETGIDPSGVSARPPMPAYRLNADDAKAVAEYLSSLKQPY